MSNVVAFLEELGGSAEPNLRSGRYADLVASASLDPNARLALLRRDLAALKQALNSGEVIFCGIMPAENDEPQDMPADDAPGDDEPSFDRE